ncbi:dihydrodipicolinate synthase/N-acetylneuraminate lyase [Neobacillus niacini]|uniref:dihydrodipicolinate synthase family protein n=1 Tax=Neobacillus niacini TaxID=86668 RepID=UPI00285F9810|nr:dihydrodipicolinate synthase family protein [Neobacillus niacini]MDR7080210.1 dihydrodipicolinate synthase/N-acetylneuraminate lyase [Neobacillus niacini]
MGQGLVTPFKEGDTYTIDFDEYRKFVQYFLQDKFVDVGIVNPEAAEIFYLTSDERKKLLEITLQEVNGMVPVFSGFMDLRSKGYIEQAK